MNSINPDIKFTTETCEDFKNGRLPTLDTEWEILEGKISHSYYEKEMKTPYQVMARSAMGKQSKISILSNELIRRLNTVSPEIKQEEILRIVEHYIMQLKISGYSRRDCREIVVCGLVGFMRKRKKRLEENGGKAYKKGKDTIKTRNKKKLLANTN